MRKSNIWLMVALALGVTSGGVSAQNAFVEGVAGITKVDLGNTSGWTVDNRDRSLGFTAGYMFNPYVGAEFGYRDLGDVSASITANFSGTLYGRALTGNGTLRVTGDASGWIFGPRFELPINNDFSVVGRIGWYRWESQQSANVNAAFTWGGTAYAANVTARQKVTGTDAYFGVGASYNINKQAAVGLEYSRFKVDSTDVDTWNLTAKYKF